MINNIINFSEMKDRKHQMIGRKVKNRITEYKVGDKFHYQSRGNGKWVICEIKGRRVKIMPLNIWGATQLTYNASYFEKLLSNNTIEMLGDSGEMITLTGEQKQAILEMGPIKEKGVEWIELLLSLGIEKCELKKDLCRSVLTKREFEHFWGIVKKQKVI